MAEAEKSWTLAELAEETGLAPRTIRYYIWRGLLEGPVVAGRGAAYTASHLERLQAIQQLQSDGLMLAEIARVLAGTAAANRLPQPVSWQTYALADEVVVQVRTDVAPWRAKQIRDALREFLARIEAREA